MRLRTANTRFLGWALALICACGGNTTEVQTLGGETHFLQHCSDECGSDLTCIGGVCTRSCLVAGDGNECRGLGTQVSCTADSVEPGDVAVCDLACTDASACLELGAEYRCDSGFCRAGSAPNQSQDLPLICEDYLDQPADAEVKVFARNGTSGVIYLAGEGCNARLGPLLAEGEDGRVFSLQEPRCAISCEEATRSDQTQGQCPAVCSIASPIRLAPGQVFELPSITFLHEQRRIPSTCSVGFVEDDLGCYQRTTWPEGFLDFRAVAYEAKNCDDPEVCDCNVRGAEDRQGGQYYDETRPDCTIFFTELQEAGLTTATLRTTYTEIAESGLEVVFLDEAL